MVTSQAGNIRDGVVAVLGEHWGKGRAFLLLLHEAHEAPERWHARRFFNRLRSAGWPLLSHNARSYEGARVLAQLRRAP
jgi:hypothetical protein